jgi:glutathione S-transferase
MDETGDRLAPGEHIFHISTIEDWQAAQRAGDYRVSTLGRSLADEGYIHASRSHQVDGVRAAFYEDPGLRLVLLEIDPARLDVDLRLEVPPGGDEAFPHIYGPLVTDAVISVTDLPEPSQTGGT